MKKAICILSTVVLLLVSQFSFAYALTDDENACVGTWMSYEEPGLTIYLFKEDHTAEVLMANFISMFEVNGANAYALAKGTGTWSANGDTICISIGEFSLPVMEGLNLSVKLSNAEYVIDGNKMTNENGVVMVKVR